MTRLGASLGEDAGGDVPQAAETTITSRAVRAWGLNMGMLFI
jgi:hypothetical protein